MSPQLICLNDLVDMTEDLDEEQTPPTLSRSPAGLKATSPEYVPGQGWKVELGGDDSPATAASTAVPSLPSYEGLPYSEYGAEYGVPACGSDDLFGYKAVGFYGDGLLDSSCVVDASHLDPFSRYDLTPGTSPMDFASNGQYSETPWGAYDDGFAVTNGAAYAAGSDYYAWAMLEAEAWAAEASAAGSTDAVDLASATAAALNVPRPPPPAAPAVPPGQHLETSGNGKASVKTRTVEFPSYDRFELLRLRALARCGHATAPVFRVCALQAS